MKNVFEDIHVTGAITGAGTSDLALKVGGVAVTASAAELNLIDGSIAGTAVASKALALGSDKNVDVLVVADGGLFLGSGAGTAVSATAAELNIAADVSAQTEAVVAAGALSVTKRISTLAVVSGGAVTLAAPSASMLGHVKVIEMTTDDGDVTLALTNVVGGSAGTTATFSAVNQALVLVSGTNKWHVVAESGVVLS